MSTSISQDKIWTSELNRTDDILSRFDRSKPVHFYDTTLRDGEQSVGVCFTPDEKFNIACKLNELGVGRIESGFPRVSADDTQAVRAHPGCRSGVGDMGFFPGRQGGYRRPS